jgi:hypothetical protein
MLYSTTLTPGKKSPGSSTKRKPKPIAGFNSAPPQAKLASSGKNRTGVASGVAAFHETPPKAKVAKRSPPKAKLSATKPPGAAASGRLPSPAPSTALPGGFGAAPLPAPGTAAAGATPQQVLPIKRLQRIARRVHHRIPCWQRRRRCCFHPQQPHLQARPWRGVRRRLPVRRRQEVPWQGLLRRRAGLPQGQ